jgi:hypothetical protein
MLKPARTDPGQAGKRFYCDCGPLLAVYLRADLPSDNACIRIASRYAINQPQLGGANVTINSRVKNHCFGRVGVTPVTLCDEVWFFV